MSSSATDKAHSPVWRVERPEDLAQTAASILKHCADYQKFALCGEMGAGKTALVMACCRQLGLAEEGLGSPSFAIVHEYGPDPVVFHLDLYRLKNADELDRLGMERYLDGPEYCFVEWPELADSWFSEEVVRLQIDAHQDGSRSISLLRPLPQSGKRTQ